MLPLFFFFFFSYLMLLASPGRVRLSAVRPNPTLCAATSSYTSFRAGIRSFKPCFCSWNLRNGTHASSTRNIQMPSRYMQAGVPCPCDTDCVSPLPCVHPQLAVPASQGRSHTPLPPHQRPHTPRLGPLHL